MPAIVDRRLSLGKLARQTPQWAISAVAHAGLLLLLTLWHLDGRPERKQVQVVTTVIPPAEEEQFIDIIETFNRAMSAPSAVKPVSSTDLAAAASASSIQANLNEAAVEQAMRREVSATVLRPLGSVTGKVSLDQEVSGLKGTNLSGGTDSGSVDRITLEIIRQLEKNKVLAVWVMDSTESLKERRGNIIQRFEKVYDELARLDKGRTDTPLLTAIMGFGKEPKIITPQPTADRKALSEAVKNIKGDDSGTENVFSAVKRATTEWRKYQTTGRRKLMIIVLTDEMGDDIALLDETVDLVKRNQASVYVMGPLSPFGRKEINVRWVDKPTGEVFMLPVERGPESLQAEHLTLPYWNQAGPSSDFFSSGFGPYALTRLARESAGIYMIFDDEALAGPKFSNFDLLEYLPEYSSIREYEKMIVENPLRAAVINAARESRALDNASINPQFMFTQEGIQDQLTRAQRPAAQLITFVDKTLSNLQAVEKFRAREKSKRWQAHYDLMMGRLLAAKVRCNEYTWMLAQMKTNPLTPEGKNNAWRLSPDKEIGFGKKNDPAGAAKKKDEPQTNVRKSNPKMAEQGRKEAEAAVTYLKRVSEECKGTPWAMMADRELATPLGFKWSGFYVQPPPRADEKKKPNPQPKAEQEKQMRRDDAAKRAPKKI